MDTRSTYELENLLEAKNENRVREVASSGFRAQLSLLVLIGIMLGAAGYGTFTIIEQGHEINLLRSTLANVTADLESLTDIAGEGLLVELRTFEAQVANSTNMTQASINGIIGTASNTSNVTVSLSSLNNNLQNLTNTTTATATALTIVQGIQNTNIPIFNALIVNMNNTNNTVNSAQVSIGTLQVTQAANVLLITGLQQGQIASNTTIGGIQQNITTVSGNIVILQQGQVGTNTTIAGLQQGQVYTNITLNTLQQGQLGGNTSILALQQGQTASNLSISLLQSSQVYSNSSITAILLAQAGNNASILGLQQSQAYGNTSIAALQSGQLGANTTIVNNNLAFTTFQTATNNNFLNYPPNNGSTTCTGNNTKNGTETYNGGLIVNGIFKVNPSAAVSGLTTNSLDDTLNIPRLNLSSTWSGTQIFAQITAQGIVIRNVGALAIVGTDANNKTTPIPYSVNPTANSVLVRDAFSNSMGASCISASAIAFELFPIVFTTYSTSLTLPGTTLITGFVILGGSGSLTVTLPTAALLYGVFPMNTILPGFSFKVTFTNAGTGSWTIAPGAGMSTFTASPTLTLAVGTSKNYRFVVVTSATFNIHDA